MTAQHVGEHSCGAGAGEKAPGCCCVTWRFCDGNIEKIHMIFVKFEQFLNKLKEKKGTLKNNLII